MQALLFPFTDHQASEKQAAGRLGGRGAQRESLFLAFFFFFCGCLQSVVCVLVSLLCAFVVFRGPKGGFGGTREGRRHRHS